MKFAILGTGVVGKTILLSWSSPGKARMPSVTSHGPKRAILYARVSTEEQARSGYSHKQQIEALRDYVIREGHESNPSEPAKERQ